MLNLNDVDKSNKIKKCFSSEHNLSVCKEQERGVSKAAAFMYVKAPL